MDSTTTTNTSIASDDKQQSQSSSHVLWPPPGPTNALPPLAYQMKLDEVPKVGWKRSGTAQVVTGGNFPVLQGSGVTSFLVELFDESMRIPHWHSQNEVGYVQSGVIEIYLWRSASLTEAAVFTVPAGSLWFIPQGALHSLNNVSGSDEDSKDSKAVLIIGFDSESPTDFDLPVAFNGLPETLRRAYTQKGHHQQLARYIGPVFDPLTGFLPRPFQTSHSGTKSPFAFELATAKPLYQSRRKGSVVWAVQDNWPILSDGKIAFVRTVLKPGVARDAIWWPNASVLYVVARGSVKFTLVFSGWEAQAPLLARHNDMVFVPTGVMHTFENDQEEEAEVVGFFNAANPLPEVSLGAATNFFPRPIANAALVDWGNKRPPSPTPTSTSAPPNSPKPKRGSESDSDDSHPSRPLAHLRQFHKSPYLLTISKHHAGSKSKHKRKSVVDSRDERDRKSRHKKKNKK